MTQIKKCTLSRQKGCERLLTRITLALTRFLSPIENSCSAPPDSQNEGSKKEFKRFQHPLKEDLSSKDLDSQAVTQKKEGTKPKLKLVSDASHQEKKPEDSDIFVQLNSLFRSLAPKCSIKSIAQTYKTATRSQKVMSKSQKGIIFDYSSNEKIE